MGSGGGCTNGSGDMNTDPHAESAQLRDVDSVTIAYTLIEKLISKREFNLLSTSNKEGDSLSMRICIVVELPSSLEDKLIGMELYRENPALVEYERLLTEYYDSVPQLTSLSHLVHCEFGICPGSKQLEKQYITELLIDYQLRKSPAKNLMVKLGRSGALSRHLGWNNGKCLLDRFTCIIVENRIVHMCLLLNALVL